jgi:Protein of unknown function (DUF4242)
MGLFVAERYVPSAPPDDVAAAARLDRRAASALTEVAGHAVGITHLKTWFLPADETCFSLFEAPSAELLRTAGDAVGLRYSRISEVVEAVGDDRDDSGGASA